MNSDGGHTQVALNAHTSYHAQYASINQEKQGIGLLIKEEGLDFERWKFPERDSTG